MDGNGRTATKTLERGNGHTTLTPEDMHRFFGDGYREVEVLRDGSVRERPRNGDVTDETVTRTLKTGRTWY
jgi:hypothetical protein